MSPTEPHAILFETSPFGNIDAIVQHDGRVVYFYLNGHAIDGQNRFGTRAVWVQNLIEAPYVLDEDEARSGIAPMLPRTCSKQTKPQPMLDADQLEIVWFEEGNGAALRKKATDNSQPETLAVLPPWSGLEDFHGYAAGCIAESPLCWPMPDNPKLQQRIDAAAEFWKACGSDDHPFASLQPKILAAYDQAFGSSEEAKVSEPDDTQPSGSHYFSIDGGKFPPRGLAQYKSTGVIATVGLSLCAQPAVELFMDDPTNYRRIELAIRLTPAQMSDSELVDSAARQLSSLAAYPWRNLTWLGPGHTCGLSGIQTDSQFALLVPDVQFSNATSQATVTLPTFRGDAVNLLWLVPITAEQQKQLEAGELTADQILRQTNQ